MLWLVRHTQLGSFPVLLFFGLSLGQVTLGDALPGWQFLSPLRNGQEEYTAVADRRVTHAGKASCCIRSQLANPTGAGVLIQTFSAKEYRAKRVRLTAFLKTEALVAERSDGGAGFLISVTGETKSNLARDFMSARRVKGTTDWAKYTLVIDVPEEGAAISIGLSVAGKGTAWVDDLTFEIVGTDVPTTAEDSAPTERTGGVRTDLPVRPKNLGLEE